MKTELKIIFTYNLSKEWFGEAGSVQTITEFKDLIKQKSDFVPYTAKIQRNIVKDLQKNTPENELFNPFNNDELKVGDFITTDNMSFMVKDKLLYPKDVRSILKEKYGNTLDFDKNIDENTPVAYFYVTESERIGLRDALTGRPTSYTFRGVSYSLLTPKDIVVDTNLNQIWPVKTGKMPDALVKIFSKQKEIIR